MARYPTLDDVRGPELVEGEHLWVRWTPKGSINGGMVCCRWCGAVKRRDGVSKPCRGIVRITLRG